MQFIPVPNSSSSCIGKIHFGAVQGATSFASSFPHIFGEDESKSNLIPALIPCAIDHDPYFRMTRDVASRLHFAKPALIHARFLDALQGPGSKMSASVDSSAIFMKDEPNKIKQKINKYAYSGGQQTVEEQRNELISRVFSGGGSPSTRSHLCEVGHPCNWAQRAGCLWRHCQ